MVGRAGFRALRATQAYLNAVPGYLSEVARAAELSTLSAARIELGRQLFRDPRLSGQGKTSCATCHYPAQGFTLTTRALPKGAHPGAGAERAKPV
ncbi:MAG: cytochrome c peroxidase [Pseudomonadota bacterium]